MASTGDELPKLRMAPRESADDLTRRLERERRAAQQQREGALDGSLKPYRVGSVPYLNAVPLTRGLEQEIVFAPPSQLGEMLGRDELDAALLSVSAVLLCDRYDILDGIAIASLGEVRSVVLGYTRPLEEITEVLCDTASLTSVNLLRVLLAEQGLKPVFKPLPSYDAARSAEAVLLIGDPAIEFVRSSPPHALWDLGEAWYTLTQLPFVYAVWAVRRGIESARLCQLLREARDFGMDTLENIINTREEFDLDFRKDYLGWHIHYHLGSDERRGIDRFVGLMQKHGLGPVFPPRYIG